MDCRQKPTVGRLCPVFACASTEVQGQCYSKLLRVMSCSHLCPSGACVGFWDSKEHSFKNNKVHWELLWILETKVPQCYWAWLGVSYKYFLTVCLQQ